ARASFFPSISLTAALGIASPALSSLFEGNNRTWSVTPSASLPIFAGGTIYNNVKAMQASKKAAVATYEKAIQTAFQEVSDTLAGEESYAKQLAVLNDQVKAAKRYADIADVRYRSGTDTFLNVQTAQISYFQAQQSLITAQYNALSNRINLFKAIGGGWTNDDIKEN
ncbi:TolC family protein, partial [Basilea psittacipulmonis]